MEKVKQEFYNEFPQKTPARSIYQQLREDADPFIVGITHKKKEEPMVDFMPPADLMVEHPDHPGYYSDGTPIAPQMISKTTGIIPKKSLDIFPGQEFTFTDPADSSDILEDKVSHVWIERGFGGGQVVDDKPSRWEKIKEWIS